MKKTALILYLVLLVATALLSACSHTPFVRLSGFTEDAEKHAAEGNSQAEFYLATFKEEGVNSAASSKDAVSLYRRSSARNNPQANFELARLLLEKPGAATDAEAVRLLFSAGRHGHERAQSLLGLLNIAGRGREEFNAQIRKNRKAAESGESASQYTMAWVYQEGAGLYRSPQEAIKWLNRSARQGHVPSMRMMGDMLISGEGVTKDYQLALRWYDSASAVGDRLSAAKIETLRKSGIKGAESIKPRTQRHLSPLDQDYQTVMLKQLSDLEKASPVSALRTARRLTEIDPLEREPVKQLQRLRDSYPQFSDILISQAEIELKEGKNEAFQTTISKLIVSEFDERRLTAMAALLWQLTDETVRSATDALKNLEGSAAIDPEKRNPQKVQRQISFFREQIETGLKRKPGDSTLSSLSQRGEQLIAELSKKPPENRENTLEQLFSKGVELLGTGQFKDAAGIFSRLAKTPGYKGIAMAYVYQGIIQLAQINPSNINQAKQLRLKGIAYFQNALRFDKNVALPSGYDKYITQFEEARRHLK